jgi:hypothetical protein
VKLQETITEQVDKVWGAEKWREMLFKDQDVGMELTLNMRHLRNLYGQFSRKAGFTFESIREILTGSGIVLSPFHQNMVY